MLLESSPGPASAQFVAPYLDRFWLRRQTELSVLCRLIGAESPDLAAACELESAHATLIALGPRATRVLRSPALLLWISITRYLVLHGMHRSLPVGHVADHVRDLHRFAFAAAFAAGNPAAASLRLQRDARSTLPGLGLAFVAEPSQAGNVVHLETDGYALTSILRGDRFTTTASETLRQYDGEHRPAEWVALSHLGWNVVLDDSSEMSHPHLANNPAWTMHRLDAGYVARWRAAATDAFRMLGVTEGDLFVPVREVVTSVVPLAAPADKNLSGTNADLLGCIATSLPASTALLAETLAHEAAHTTLHVLSDETHYWTIHGEGARYRSPWRNDARPISGMLHGIFAFLAVADFWYILLENGAAGEWESLGRQRLAKVAAQLRAATAEVADSAELTEAGHGLLAAATQKLDTFGAAHASPTSLRSEFPRHSHETAAAPERRLDAEWTSELGLPMPPRINAAADNVVRREQVSDVVQSAAAEHEPDVSRWLERANATQQSEPESAALIQGSISYGQGDFANAVQSYTVYVELRWTDVDAWRLLSAALRRLGRIADASALLFDLEKLQAIAPHELRRRWGRDWPLHAAELAGRRDGLAAGVFE